MPANSYVSAADCAAMDAETATTARPTPGPWHVGDAPYETTTIYSEPDKTGARMKIAECRGWGHLTGGGALALPPKEAAGIQDANARLIAAAPELLHWLKQCEHALSSRELLGPPLTEGERWLLGNVRTAIQQSEEPGK